MVMQPELVVLSVRMRRFRVRRETHAAHSGGVDDDNLP
jgi:hypothetical protein